MDTKRTDHPPNKTGEIRVVSLLLFALAFLELLAFKGPEIFAIIAAYLWIAGGVVATTFLAWQYIRSILQGLSRFSLWPFIPLLCAVPVCLFHIDGFRALNTESLSELQYSYEQLARADFGYTKMFWYSYPGRSLLLNYVPSLFVDPAPWVYRIGFALPLLLGGGFLYSGLAIYYRQCSAHRMIAGVTSSCLFAFPMVVTFCRTFEMATSSLYFGLWTVAALLHFVARPSALTAFCCAWCGGLLGASFTSGLALVALMVLMLVLWALHCLRQGDRRLGMLLISIIVYTAAVTVMLYLQHPKTLQPQIGASLELMIERFQDAVIMTFSIDKEVFIPKQLVIPVLLMALAAMTLRLGWLPVLILFWTMPVIWSAANLQGKIAPQLPFALYRALVLIPPLLWCISKFLEWITQRVRFPVFVWSILGICGLAYLAYCARPLYYRQNIFQRSAIAMNRESIMERLVAHTDKMGLSPFDKVALLQPPGDPRIQSALPCAQYLLPGWSRLNRELDIKGDKKLEPMPYVYIAVPPTNGPESIPVSHTRADFPFTFHLSHDSILEGAFVVLYPSG
jgi:hypothetical protein